MDDPDVDGAAADDVAVPRFDIDVGGVAGAVHDDFNVGALAQDLAGRDVVCERVGVYRVDKPRAEKFREPQVLLDLRLFGVNDAGELCFFTANEIGEAAA